MTRRHTSYSFNYQ